MSPVRLVPNQLLKMKHVPSTALHWGTDTFGDGPATGESAARLSRSSTDNTELDSPFLFVLRRGLAELAARGGGGACESSSLDARRALRIFSDPRMELMSFSEEPAMAD